MDTDIPMSMSIPLSRWFTKEYVKEIGRSKIGHMMTAQESIISKFDKYWDDFAPFVLEIIHACFPSGQFVPNGLTHSKMLEILARAKQVVHDDEPASGILDKKKQPRPGTVSGVPLAKKGRQL
jgi:hypothetical protein